MSTQSDAKCGRCFECKTGQDCTAALRLGWDQASAGTATFPVTAGALLRRHVRAELDLHGLTYREHKGWIESTFIVSGPLPAANRFRAWLAGIDAGRYALLDPTMKENHDHEA